MVHYDFTLRKLYAHHISTDFSKTTFNLTGKEIDTSVSYSYCIYYHWDDNWV